MKLMAASRQEISKWFDEMKSLGHEYLLVVCDTFDHEDYPVGVSKRAIRTVVDEYNKQPLQRVIECYDLSMDKDTQMSEYRAWNLGEE